MGFPTLLREALTVLNRDLIGWDCFVLRILKRVLERNAALGVNVGPIASAGVHKDVFLNRCSVYCFPV